MSIEMLLVGQQWNIPLLCALILIVIGYILLFIKKRLTINTKSQPILLIFSLCLFYLTIGSPLSAISHFNFSFHMIQMSIVYFIIPPLFIRSSPKLHVRTRNSFLGIQIRLNMKLLTISALLLFAILFFLYHLPVVMQFIFKYPMIRIPYLVILFILAFFMWWPLASTKAKIYFDQKQKRKFVLLSAMILMPACMIFIISALFNGMHHPFLNQVTTQLCIPPTVEQTSVVPFSFNTRIDQGIAGFSMLGIHKIGLRLSTHLNKHCS
ncbi:cytochrome c oxidase assembly protein [Virgibacillus salarius]|uniref:cytochrome c oxidase assembly protein n=1 Tax=Virgibacillus salarius TaxID=447199 RepID=UPI0031D82F58